MKTSSAKMKSLRLMLLAAATAIRMAGEGAPQAAPGPSSQDSEGGPNLTAARHAPQGTKPTTIPKAGPQGPRGLAGDAAHSYRPAAASARASGVSSLPTASTLPGVPGHHGPVQATLGGTGGHGSRESPVITGTAMSGRPLGAGPTK
jgi:hypothetical protein